MASLPARTHLWFVVLFLCFVRHAVVDVSDVFDASLGSSFFDACLQRSSSRHRVNSVKAQPRQGTNIMPPKITTFFVAKPKPKGDAFIHWKARKISPGTTTVIQVELKARPGSFVVHATHGKAKLVSQPEPGKLEIEFEDIDLATFREQGPTMRRVIVDAADCSNPTAAPREWVEEDNSRMIQRRMHKVRTARFGAEQGVSNTVRSASGGQPAAVPKSKGKCVAASAQQQTVGAGSD
jgi:hypothetical protein